MLVFAVTFIVFVSIVEGEMPLSIIILSLIFGFIGFVGLVVGIDRGKQSTIEITMSSISEHVKGKLVTEIAWGPDVTLEVRTNEGRRNDTHGPLAGYYIWEEGKGPIEIDPRDGWSMGDIRKAWEPVIGIARSQHLKMGEELEKYLESRSREGLDG